jgi:hypothetical protein
VNSSSPIWSPDGSKVLAYVWNEQLQYNDGLAEFDPSGRTPPQILTTVDLGDATWQRLAP